ncbi:MAG: hypothetical protein AABZ06_00120 [Bdellovibrionota bacterium]
MKPRNEYDVFMSGSGLEPPRVLTDRIFAHVAKDLNPSPWSVFSKVAFIHAVVGALSLLFCPQFGMSFLHFHGLMGVLMQFGEHVCMFGCGAFFVGSSALLISFVLRPEEVTVVRRTRLVQLGILSLVSVGIFICVGAKIVASLTLVWLFGSVIGGLASLELGWVIRRKLKYRFI